MPVNKEDFRLQIAPVSFRRLWHFIAVAVHAGPQARSFGTFCAPLCSARFAYAIHPLHGTGALLLPLSDTVTAPGLSLGATNGEVMTQKDIPEVLLCLGGSGLGVARVCHLPCSCRGESHNYPCGNFSDTSS